MTTERRTAPNQPLFKTLLDDYHIVTADIRRRGLQRTIARGFSGIEAFYLTEEDRRHLATLPGVRRFFRRIWWLVSSLLGKLTPARRIMLAAALLFLIGGRGDMQIGRLNIEFRFTILGSFLLIVLLMLELKDKLVARDELESGRAVQLALMPGHSPEIPGWQVWLYTEPANDVGGDLVDHLQIDGQRHFVALGDVAGKALPAALLSVKLQATLRALAPNFERLGDLGGALNRILHRDGLPSRFASLAYLELTAGSGRVRVLNAGHMPPLVLRGGEITAMERGSMVLGLIPEARFGEQMLDVGVGDTVVIYSDGVSEAMNEAQDFFGDERLTAAIQRAAEAPVDRVGQTVLDAVADFVGEAVRSDDISLIVARRA